MIWKFVEEDWTRGSLLIKDSVGLMSSHGKNIGGAKPDIDDANYQVYIYMLITRRYNSLLKTTWYMMLVIVNEKFSHDVNRYLYKFVFPKPRVSYREMNVLK